MSSDYNDKFWTSAVQWCAIFIAQSRVRLDEAIAESRRSERTEANAESRNIATLTIRFSQRIVREGPK